MSFSSIVVRPISPVVGVEVSGVDLSRPLPAEQVEDINRAYAQSGLVVFRKQLLTPEQHIAAARQFGEINVNRFFRPVEGYPEIAEVRKEPDQKGNIGGNWHTDHSYDQIPAKGSLLYARELPPVGGDTLFSGLYAAYEALSDGLKETLSRLHAVHSSRHVFGYNSRATGEDMKGRLQNPDLATQDAVHPVIVTHPDSGRKVIYVNPSFTLHFEGWTIEESRPLLDYLYAHCSRPEFVAHLRWEPGTLAFWDNRSTWHLALNNYSGHRRLLHRITLEGGPLH